MVYVRYACSGSMADRAVLAQTLPCEGVAICQARLSLFACSLPPPCTALTNACLYMWSLLELLNCCCQVHLQQNLRSEKGQPLCKGHHRSTSPKLNFLIVFVLFKPPRDHKLAGPNVFLLRGSTEHCSSSIVQAYPSVHDLLECHWLHACTIANTQ